MEFFETYKDDIMEFFNALVEFIKALFAKLTAPEAE